jgi:hypothetical protein
MWELKKEMLRTNEQTFVCKVSLHTHLSLELLPLRVGDLKGSAEKEGDKVGRYEGRSSTRSEVR